MKQIIFLGSLIILFSACGGKQNSDETGEARADDKNITLTEAQIKNAGLTTGKLQQKIISTILKVNGKIDVPPQNMVSVSVPLGGYLKSTKLLPGMHVKRGEVIAVMEDQQYIQLQQDYLTAKAKISYLENEYNRQKDLNQTRASSDKVFQQSEAEYKSQLVLIASLAEKLKLAGINIDRLSELNISRSVNIYSPINGFVSRVNVNIGKYIAPTEVMFELINPTDIHLALKVFERDLDKLFIGQKLVAYTNNRPDEKHPCEILLIGKDLSPERNTDVHCHFETYDKSLVPGTYMNAEIDVKNNKALALPDDAVVSYGGKQFIYRAKGNDKFEMVEVSVGESENGFTEIKIPEGSTLGTSEFVTRGAYSILMLMKNKAD
ncbi:efflux RND transporter periplasmic adaptor subunit [Flavihumibacter profundi]|uniref:efflux RND transporter periplasmic adaptor subunit n=1 Tax=Flavihumibacter profundi TaxID=2716883 RepID=UPI001CC6C3EE|nr:efflux RND transporter periplasmic adaptor subunit [Flavihumibacter profundi]MBZ5856718.1 efflux RND transporter periplasmic adaptor subunit [Flavihumibacter profundi]